MLTLLLIKLQHMIRFITFQVALISLMPVNTQIRNLMNSPIVLVNQWLEIGRAHV